MQVSYQDGQGFNESLLSTGVGPITAVNDTPIGLPVITGTATEDQTLTADTSGIADVDGLGSFSYQWFRDGTAINGATASTFVLGDADVGTTITVQVSYQDGQGFNESLLSTGVGPIAGINDAPLGQPVVTGITAVDQLLTADTSGISDVDGLGTYSYQWFRSGTLIAGATNETYLLTNADVDTFLSVQVSYTDGQGTEESLQSTLVGPIQPLLPPNNAPVFDSAPVTNVTAGTAYVYQVAVTDVDVIDNLTITAASLPGWLALTDNGDGTATLSGVPLTADVGTYDIVLSVSDGQVSVEQGFALIVDIDPNQTPVIESDGGGTAATLAVSEGTALVTAVVATDADGDALTYSITGGADAAAFQIDAQTGALQFISPVPAYFSPADADGDNTYLVTVAASDEHGAITAQALSVVVGPSPLNPVLAEAIAASNQISPEADSGTAYETVAQSTPGTGGAAAALADAVISQTTGSGAANTGSSQDSDTEQLTEQVLLAELAQAPGSLQDLIDDTVGQDEVKSVDGVADAVTADERPPTDNTTNDNAPAQASELVRATLLAGASGMHLDLTQLETALNTTSFNNALDEMRRALTEVSESKGKSMDLRAEVATGIGMSLTAGIVQWVLRTGSLMFTLVSTMPVWRFFDPLPIFAGAREADAVMVEGADEKATAVAPAGEVETLFDKAAEQEEPAE
ncbi:MAG: hypothetical protein H6978_01035 [Gammaproteobacteria bacterium]|nr:hypothetical protein [Gammaproteobacteria bacterium]